MEVLAENIVKATHRGSARREHCHSCQGLARPTKLPVLIQSRRNMTLPALLHGLHYELGYQLDCASHAYKVYTCMQNYITNLMQS